MSQKELAELLEDFHRRRALGESPSVEDYRERAGNDHEEFQRVLEAEAVLDAAMATEDPSPYPMPFGEYTLLSELGRGAAGVVYEAMHRTLGRTVALKILKSGFDTHPTAIERFRREARACAQVRHDHIVEVYEAGEHEGRHFYAMALMKGQSLKQAARDGRLPEAKELAQHIAGVVDALAELHERGIVHRDIKPSNIMMETAGRMVLADFGLARTVASEQLTMTGETLGTPLYMSPEQLLGDIDKIDGRTDVYGMGASLYEILAGQPIFAANDVGSLMRMILAQRPQPLHEVAPHVPRGLSDIVMKALEKRRRDRYETATELRDDLLAFASGDEVHGRPVSGAVRAGRALKRYWYLTAAGVAGITVALTYALKPLPPVKLVIASIPRATVFLNGENKGSTRAELDVPRGGHEIILRAQGFRDRTVKLTLDGNQDLEKVLQPNDPTDPKALEMLAQSVDVEMGKWEQISSTRSSIDESRIYVLFPRGDVRPEDASTFEFRLGAEFSAEGAIVFQANDKELYRRTIDNDWPENTDTVMEMPAAVREALATGASVTWGFHPSEGDPILASFQLGDAELPAIAKRLDSLAATARSQILAQLHLDRGYAVAAYRMARAVAKDHKAPKAYAIMKGALEQMAITDRENPLWGELADLSNR
ncbi:MAG: protein kinase [Planctomycetota bacterium]|nr:protein kinase [Planctomycetota bacterium]